MLTNVYIFPSCYYYIIEEGWEKGMSWVKKRRNELNVTKDEQFEQQVTLNEIIRDRQRLATQDFITLIILYISATLFFSDSKCMVPWHIVEQIANI